MRVLEFHAEQLSAAQAEWKRTRSPHNPSRTPYVLLGVVAAVALVLARLPSLLFDPGKLYFGAMTVGAELDRSVRLLNRGTSPVAIKDVVLTGDTSAFTINSDECRAKQLAAGEHCSLGLHFKSSEGPHEGKVLVSTDGGENSQQLVVSGAGIGVSRLVLSSSDVNFDKQRLGETASKVVTARNNGVASVHISGVTGGDPSKFSVDEKCSGRKLSRGEACDIRIDFNPVSEGAATSSLELSDDTSESPHVIRIRGTGVAPPGPVPLVPVANVNPGSILFGPERVGARSAGRDITISNSGNAPLELHSLALQDQSFTVTHDNCSGRTLSPNTSCNIAVAFGPAAPGDHSTELRFATNVPTGAITIPLSGLGIQPPPGRLSISPSDVDFGSVDLGHSRGVSPRELLVSNAGGSVLNIGQTELQGSPDFTISNSSCQGRLEAGASCKLLLSFSPKAPGAQSARLMVTAPPDESPQFAALRGSASAPPTPVAIMRVIPPSLDFGQQNVLERQRATQDITIANAGSGELEIRRIALEGATRDFHILGRNCGSRLAPGAMCSLTVMFTPRVPGNRTAQVVFASNSVEPMARVSLTGFGRTPPPPPGRLSIAPSDVDFGSVDLGRTRSVARRRVVVSNTGGSALNVGRTELQGSPDFAISNSGCQGRLDAGASCSVILSFSPNAAGAQSARLMVTAVPDAVPQFVTLRGSASALPTIALAIMRVTPPSINFGQRNILERRATQDITIANAGSGELEVRRIAIEGAPRDFQILGRNCGSRLAPGATCSLTVMFMPRVPGNRTAQVVFASNSAEPVAPVTLAGFGIRTPPPPPSGLTGTSDGVGPTAQPSCWQPNAVRIYFRLLSKNSPSSGRVRATGVVVNQGTGASGPSPAQIELQQRDKGWHVVAARPISSLPPNASVTVTYDTDVRANDEFSPDYLLVVRFQPMGRERMRRPVAATCNPQPSRIEQGIDDARNLVQSSSQTPLRKRFDKRISPPNNPPK